MDPTIYEATYGWIVGERDGTFRVGYPVVNRISVHRTRAEAEAALEKLKQERSANCKHEWGMNPNPKSPDMCIHCGGLRCE